ncbi:MAG: AAA family ATPase, partial [Spirochaetes bacterium]|nr:AAA family ATPase [Spirochaetota bacterium]
MDINIDSGLLNIIDDYIKLKTIQLHSSKQEIPLENGWIIREIKASTIYGFNIDSEIFNKLDSLNGDYSIEINSENYTCDIVNLNEKQVNIKIQNYVENIKSCKFLIDMSFIQKKQIQALETFKTDSYKSLRAQILGRKEIGGGEQVKCIYDDFAPNQYQEKAIKSAVGIKDIVLIWGPPGTGKTKIVPEIASNFQRVFKSENNRETKILICAWTNTAVDNIVKVLFNNKCDIIRYGKLTTLGKEYDNILFKNILEDYKKKIEKEYSEIIKNLYEKISNIEHLISTDNNNLKKLDVDISSIKSKISKIYPDIKKIIKNGLENDVLIRQDSIKQYDKQLEDINNEITGLEIDITKTNDIIKQNNLEIDKLQKNIEILKHRILNQSKIRETANKYLLFIKQHPIKYRFYYHTGLIPPDFHDELIKYDMQRTDGSTLIQRIKEIDTKIDDLECQQTEATTQKIKRESEKEKIKSTL